MFNLLSEAWKGKTSLAKAYWLVHVLFTIILGILIYILLSFMDPHSAALHKHHHLLTKAIVFPYTLFSAICVWRCSRNSTAFWRIIAKILVSLSVLGGLFAVLRVIF